MTEDRNLLGGNEKGTEMAEAQFDDDTFILAQSRFYVRSFGPSKEVDEHFARSMHQQHYRGSLGYTEFKNKFDAAVAVLSDLPRPR